MQDSVISQAHPQAPRTRPNLPGADGASFYQLVSLLERHFDEAPPVGSTTNAAAERIRFGAWASLAFPPGDIADLSWQERPDRDDLVRMSVTFLGLYGPSSPLPTFYTEQILHDDDMRETLRDFYDLFNHRLTSLLYKTWSKYRYYKQFRGTGQDAASRGLFALAGVQRDGREHDDSVDWTRLISHAGLLGFNSCPPGVLARLLSHYFAVPVRVEEAIERVVPIAPEQRHALGERGNALGSNWVLGEGVVDISGMFRVWVGPVTRAVFDDFVPGGRNHVPFFDLVRRFARNTLHFDVKVVLSDGEIEPWALRDDELPLGQLTWLGNAAESRAGVSLPGARC